MHISEEVTSQKEGGTNESLQGEKKRKCDGPIASIDATDLGQTDEA